jgi:hypothetical protein
MRISVSSWATTEEDVRRSLDAMLSVASGEKNSIGGTVTAEKRLPG